MHYMYTKRDDDGLMGKAHTHYSRNVFENHLLHACSLKNIGGCKDIRCITMEKIRKELSDEWLEENVSGDSAYALHHADACACENGEIGKEKKEMTNKKRSDFYKTVRWLEIKKNYKEKSQKKNELINRLMELKNNSNKAKLTKETIAKLMDLL